MLTYEQRVDQAVDYLTAWLRIKAPKDTWNLALNGIKKSWDEQNKPIIVIGGELAPYAVYTNEEWVSPKWNGRPNPNQGWIQMAVEEAKPILISILTGIITQEEYIRMVGDIQAGFVTSAQAQMEAKEQ